ncbi:hypothetical protein BaRGS_00019155 [Batillaria attramentaria]|uniref:Uncharacterized protein n=1 Tax=Batillaria attramentaria TaxID=370345 RepID=A0ABD0KQG4_9CAEN
MKVFIMEMISAIGVWTEADKLNVSDASLTMANRKRHYRVVTVPGSGVAVISHGYPLLCLKIFIPTDSVEDPALHHAWSHPRHLRRINKHDDTRLVGDMETPTSGNASYALKHRQVGFYPGGDQED